jgi:DNA modification methylase
MRVEEVSITDIDPGVRYRSKEDYDFLTLVPSIRQFGVLQSITVLDKESVTAGIRNQQNERAPFLLLAGGRRFYASQMAQHSSIPARILSEGELALRPEELEQDNLVEMRVREIELEENIQRKDLNDHDQVMLTEEIHRLKQEKYGDERAKLRKDPEQPGWGHGDTAKLLSKSRSAVALDLALAAAAKQDPEVAAALKTSKSEAKRVINNKEKRADITKRAAQVVEKDASTPEDVKKRRLMESYVVADAFEAIKTEPDCYYNFVELDPDWGIDFKQSYDAVTREARPDDIEEYTEIPVEDYASQMEAYLAEVYRVMKPESWGTLFFGNKTMKEVNQNLLIAAGFKVDAMPAIWVKELGGSYTRNPAFTMSYDYESFFTFRKGPANIRIDRQGHSNVFPFKRVAGARKTHRTEKPIELYEEIFGLFVPPGAKILVGFAGSGNALFAGSNLGCTVKGYDLSDHFRKQFLIRVHSTPFGEYRSHEPGKARIF